MEVITSTKNQYVKMAKSLANKKFRNKTGLFLIEGLNIFKDMPESVNVEYVFVSEEKASKIAQIVDKFSCQVYYVNDAILGYISDTVSPNGIIAVCKKPQTQFAYPKSKAILLDRVSDPGNIGTIFRTAAATGFDTIYLYETADIFSPKVVRSTLGGLFKINAIEVDENQALDLIQNLESCVLDMGGKNILENKIPSPMLLIAGSEAHGVKEEFKQNAKNVYALPMQNGIESLNVAVASAVAMYQTV